MQQKLTGTLVYDVHDTGKKATPGSGVRPDQTNMEQFFHNDNSYNTTQPEYVALLCVRPAKTGGVSQVISFYTLHNELLRAHKGVVSRLYQPFSFDRQKEYLPGSPRCCPRRYFPRTTAGSKCGSVFFRQPAATR